MAEGAGEWAARLRRYAAACRASTPLLSRDALVGAQEWQYRIISDSIPAGMREYSPRYFREQAVVNRRWGYNNPVVVFTSNAAGLVAATEIIDTGHEQIVFLLGSECDVSPCGEEDVGEGFYRHFWSTVDTEAEIDPEYLAQVRAEHPIPDGCIYWRHSEGSWSGPLASRCVTQFWCWDGKTPTVIEGAGVRMVS